MSSMSETGYLSFQMIASYEIDTVLTFDRGGVSGHANHTSIYNAMVFLSLENRLPLGSNPLPEPRFNSLSRQQAIFGRKQLC